MNRPSSGSPYPPGDYEIRVLGHLAPRWAATFEPMRLTLTDDGATVIAGPVADQAALHGLLNRLRDLGLPLISLHPVPADPSEDLTPGEPT